MKYHLQKDYRNIIIWDFLMYRLPRVLETNNLRSEEHFRTCAHGRTYPHVRMWGAEYL